MFISGFGIFGFIFGCFDYGFFIVIEMFYIVRGIIELVNIFLVVDIDIGYGNLLNVIRIVIDIVNMGVVGIILED